MRIQLKDGTYAWIDNQEQFKAIVEHSMGRDMAEHIDELVNKFNTDKDNAEIESLNKENFKLTQQCDDYKHQYNNLLNKYNNLVCMTSNKSESDDNDLLPF